MNRRNLLIGAAALAACAPKANGAAAPFPMRRGVNLGNALEAPAEGDWGYRIEAAHLRAIAEAGFDGVRAPVRWTTHLCMDDQVCPDFFARVDQVLDWALDAGLKVQLDLHHYDALLNLEGDARPEPRHRQRFLAIWRQIAARYSSMPDALIFEPMNEPNGRAWDGPDLAALQREVLAIIRAHNPTRLVVFGPSNWQNIDALAQWRPPEDQNVAVSVHYYAPYEFTHQNAEWLGENAPRFARAWGTPKDIEAIARDVARLRGWRVLNDYPLQLGEFGVNARAPLAQRSAWTRAVRTQFEAAGIGWCVWDFAGAFPIWSARRGAFIPEMLDALTG